MRTFRFVLFTFVVLLTGCGGGGGGSTATNNTTNTTTTTPPPGGTTPPMITGFTPTSGQVGEKVQISGLLFSDVASGNTVRFNGVTATVLSSTSSSIVATVPAGASTGPISVTTSGGTDNSSAIFNVIPASTTPGVAWTTRMSGPRPSASGIAWDGSKYVLGGDSLLTSTDVVKWDEWDTYSWVYNLKWNGQRFVGVGEFGGIEVSSDGLTWSRVSGGSEDLYGLTYSNNLWVAVGARGSIVTSPDGLTWTTRTSPVSGNLTGVTWNGSLFVAVGSSGTVLTSTDGITWTQQTAPTSDAFTAIGSTSSLFVASTFPYSGSASAFYTSTDGVNWNQNSPGIGSFNDIIYAGGQWVAVGDYSVARSSDGISWTVSSIGAGNLIGILKAVTYDGSQYVAVGESGSGAGSVYTSPDAITWSLRTSEQSLHALARRPADGQVVVATSDLSMVSTDNGTSWSYGGLNSMVGDVFLDVEWFAPLNAFVALVGSGLNSYVYTSTDGLNWTFLGNSLNGRLCASNTLLVNAGASYTGAYIFTSADGSTWTNAYTSTSGITLKDVFWTGTHFIAVGTNGTIVTSLNGSTWTEQSSGVTATLYGAAESPSIMVVVGANGKIVTSADGGTNWATQNSGTTYTLNSVVWTGSEFVAVGNYGKVVRSTDGVNWTVQPTPYNDVLTGSDPFNLNSVLWTGSGGRLIAIGDRGLVTTSP